MFRSTFDVPDEQRGDFRALVREILDWRLAEYLQCHPAASREGRPALSDG